MNKTTALTAAVLAAVLPVSAMAGNTAAVTVEPVIIADDTSSSVGAPLLLGIGAGVVALALIAAAVDDDDDDSSATTTTTADN